LLAAKDAVLIEASQDMKWLKCNDRYTNSLKIAQDIQVNTIGKAIKLKSLDEKKQFLPENHNPTRVYCVQCSEEHLDDGPWAKCRDARSGFGQRNSVNLLLASQRAQVKNGILKGKEKRIIRFMMSEKQTRK
jgi:hypothetical protein